MHAKQATESVPQTQDHNKKREEEEERKKRGEERKSKVESSRHRLLPGLRLTPLTVLWLATSQRSMRVMPSPTSVVQSSILRPRCCSFWLHQRVKT